MILVTRAAGHLEAAVEHLLTKTKADKIVALARSEGLRLIYDL